MQSKKSFFSIRIKKLREDRGLSMSQLATALNTTKSSINMWENGNAFPREKTLIKIADFFDVSIDFLYGIDKRDLQLQRVKKLQKKVNINAEKLKLAIDHLSDNDLEKLMQSFKSLFGEKYLYIINND